MDRGRHRIREASPRRPLTYYAAGHWMRSAHPSRYDAWPVLAPLTDYQRRILARHAAA